MARLLMMNQMNTKENVLYSDLSRSLFLNPQINADSYYALQTIPNAKADKKCTKLKKYIKALPKKVSKYLIYTFIEVLKCHFDLEGSSLKDNLKKGIFTSIMVIRHQIPCAYGILLWIVAPIVVSLLVDFGFWAYKELRELIRSHKLRLKIKSKNNDQHPLGATSFLRTYHHSFPSTLLG